MEGGGAWGETKGRVPQIGTMCFEHSIFMICSSRLRRGALHSTDVACKDCVPVRSLKNTLKIKVGGP